MSLPPRPERRRAPHTRRPGAHAWYAAAAIAGVLAVSCTSAQSSETAARPDARVPAPTTTTTRPPPPPEPDKLADPGVAPGACALVRYTPPTAKEALSGELCRPAEHQRDVAIIVIHGGSGVGGSYANMRRWANRYLAEGYVTFLPAYHLFREGSSERPVFPRPEQNIKAAVQFLRATGNALGIRKDRIVVQGQSAGARVGSVAYTTPDDPWFAGPELYPGISDAVNGFIGFYHPYDGTMQFAFQYFGGDETSRDPLVQERLAKADALANASRAVGPAIFLTGSKDWNIIVLQQDEFANALRQRGMPTSTVVVDGGGHGFDEGGSRLSRLGEQAATDTLRWLNEQFPQNPPREAQTAPIDLAKAPNNTGAPPTTYRVRTRSGGSAGAGGGATPTTTGEATSTTDPSAASTTSSASSVPSSTTTVPASSTTVVPTSTTASTAPTSTSPTTAPPP